MRLSGGETGLSSFAMSRVAHLAIGSVASVGNGWLDVGAVVSMDGAMLSGRNKLFGAPCVSELEIKPTVSKGVPAQPRNCLRAQMEVQKPRSNKRIDQREGIRCHWTRDR